MQGALRRNNYLAAVGRTKGNLVQVNLLANTDLRSAEEFEDLIVADRGGAIIRLKDVAKVEREAEEADMVAKYNRAEGVYLGVWPVPGANEIDVAKRLRDEMDRIRPGLPPDIDMRLVWDGTPAVAADPPALLAPDAVVFVPSSPAIPAPPRLARAAVSRAPPLS